MCDAEYCSQFRILYHPCMVFLYTYLPTFTITNQPNAGKYTSPMDGMGMYLKPYLELAHLPNAPNLGLIQLWHPTSCDITVPSFPKNLLVVVLHVHRPILRPGHRQQETETNDSMTISMGLVLVEKKLTVFGGSI